MKSVKNEVKIAIVAVLGIVLLYFGMQFLKGLTLVGSGNKYYAVFSDVSGLSASTGVYELLPGFICGGLVAFIVAKVTTITVSPTISWPS